MIRRLMLLVLLFPLTVAVFIHNIVISVIVAPLAYSTYLVITGNKNNVDVFIEEMLSTPFDALDQFKKWANQ